MNLRNLDNNMTRNSLFVNTIHHQNKCVNFTMGHPKIKGGNNYGGFNKGRKNMGFHDLVDHVRYLLHYIVVVYLEM
jgi:hypothetical protein